MVSVDAVTRGALANASAPMASARILAAVVLPPNALIVAGSADHAKRLERVGWKALECIFEPLGGAAPEPDTVDVLWIGPQPGPDLWA
jgi:hypothetical protein